MGKISRGDKGGSNCGIRGFIVWVKSQNKSSRWLIYSKCLTLVIIVIILVKGKGSRSILPPLCRNIYTFTLYCYRIIKVSSLSFTRRNKKKFSFYSILLLLGRGNYQLSIINYWKSCLNLLTSEFWLQLYSNIVELKSQN